MHPEQVAQRKCHDRQYSFLDVFPMRFCFESTNFSVTDKVYHIDLQCLNFSITIYIHSPLPVLSVQKYKFCQKDFPTRSWFESTNFSIAGKVYHIDSRLCKINDKSLVDCTTTIIFYNDDLIVGSKTNNLSLFISGYIREQKINQTVIDGGSAINIMVVHAI